VKAPVKEAWSSLLKDILGGLVQPIEVDSAVGGGLAGSSRIEREDESDEEDDLSSPRKKQRTLDSKRPPPPISPKLRSHLNLLVSTSHLNALLASPSPTPSSLAFVLAILGAWPTKRNTVLSEVGSKRGLVKDLFRSEVRGGKVMRKVLDGSKGARSVLDALGGEFRTFHISLLHALPLLSSSSNLNCIFLSPRPLLLPLLDFLPPPHPPLQPHPPLPGRRRVLLPHRQPFIRRRDRLPLRYLQKHRVRSLLERHARRETLVWVGSGGGEDAL